MKIIIALIIMILGIGMFAIAPYILYNQFKYRKSENKQAELAIAYSGLYKYLSWGLLLFAFLLLSFGIISYTNTSLFIKTAIPATGKVIELIEKNSRKSGTTYAPVVNFTDKNGTLITFQSDAFQSSGTYNVGDNIQVLFQEEKSSNARVNDFYTLWSNTVFDFVMVFIGLLGWFLMKKKANKSNI